MLRKTNLLLHYITVSQRSTNFQVHERSKNNRIVTIRSKHNLCMTTSTPTNSELYKNEVKATVLNEPRVWLIKPIPISCQTVCWIQFNQHPFLESGECEHFQCLHSGE